MFKHVVSSAHELRVIMGERSPRSLDKETNYLTDACIQFISKAPFMLLATSGRNGRCDVAPKGDPAGFVRVLDEKHRSFRTARATSGSMACATSSRTPTSD
jgi:uncharacterized protein